MLIKPTKRLTHYALLFCFSPLSFSGSALAHDGGIGNEVMWSACDGRTVNDSCSFESHEHDIFRGTCQSMSGAAVCVRNQPIEYAATHTHSPEKNPSANNNPYRWAYGIAGLIILMSSGIAIRSITRIRST